jgi:hypothetical protein
MYIGQKVEAKVNGGQWCPAYVIAVSKDSVTVAGESEIELARKREGVAVGICLPLNFIRANNEANIS